MATSLDHAAINAKRLRHAELGGIIKRSEDELYTLRREFDTLSKDLDAIEFANAGSSSQIVRNRTLVS
jgi:hypothetical protein